MPKKKEIKNEIKLFSTKAFDKVLEENEVFEFSNFVELLYFLLVESGNSFALNYNTYSKVFVIDYKEHFESLGNASECNRDYILYFLNTNKYYELSISFCLDPNIIKNVLIELFKVIDIKNSDHISSFFEIENDNLFFFYDKEEEDDFTNKSGINVIYDNLFKDCKDLGYIANVDLFSFHEVERIEKKISIELKNSTSNIEIEVYSFN